MSTVIMHIVLRFREALALRWTNLPIRLGYLVDPVTPELKRKDWELKAVGENRRRDMGFTSNNIRIESALIEKAVSLDRSAFVLTKATVIHVTVNQDLFQLHDSTASWWIEMRVMSQRDRKILGYEIEFNKNYSDHVMSCLERSFVASGAERIPLCSDAEMLFLCSWDLATQWPSRLILPDIDIDYDMSRFHSGVGSSFAEQQYPVGRIKKKFSKLTIRSGPALDPKSWNEMGYLALQSSGFYQPVRLLGEIAKKISECGGKQVTGRQRGRQRRGTV